MDDWVAFLSGCMIGGISGLVPGLHPNTVIAALGGFGIDEWALSLMIISLIPSSMVSSFMIAIFFGVPDRSTVVSVLPGQRMVLEGRGLEALKTVLVSCIGATLLSVMLFQLSLDAYPLIYALIRPHMGYVLLAFSALFLIRSKNPILAALVFLVSGALGSFALSRELADPFLPLFCGMFSLASIAQYQKSDVPKQTDGRIKLDFLPSIGIGVMLGMLADMIPGIGSPSQVAALSTMLIPMDTLAYLASVSSISVSQTIFSLSTSAAIDKARVGGTALLAEHIAISENLPVLIALFMASMAIAVVFAYALRMKAAGFSRTDFSKMNLVVGAYLIALTILIDGALGLMILALSASLGYLVIRLGIERTNLMGAIIVPTLMLLFKIIL